MNDQSTPKSVLRSTDAITRALAGGALLVALVALVMTMAGVSLAGPGGGVGTPAAAVQASGGPAAGGPVAVAAAKRKRAKGCDSRPARPSAKPRPCGVLRLSKRRKFPASAIPVVARAKRADTLGGARRSDFALSCPAEAVDIGTWCLQASSFPVPSEDAGKNDYFYATRACAEEGGYLPSAAQLIGAADRVKLAGKLDDSALTASIDEDPFDGLKDNREMSGTLITTISGSSAAGSLGVTAGSKGNPRIGEPDPVPVPADPEPVTLQYVTVFDNREHGGFAGAAPVGSPLSFRCAFDKSQGDAAAEL